MRLDLSSAAIAGHGSFPRHILAHAFAVTCSGVFTALFFVALQGLLLSLFGERLFRRISSLLQALSLTLLLIVLFMFPLISGSLELLLHSGEAAVRWFPPFWFLGMYESLLDGSASPAIFHSLAARGAIPILLLIAMRRSPIPSPTAERFGAPSKARRRKIPPIGSPTSGISCCTGPACDGRNNAVFITSSARH